MPQDPEHTPIETDEEPEHEEPESPEDAERRAFEAGESGPAQTRTTTDPAVTRAFAVECARLFEADKCEHVVLLDVRGRSQVADYVIVGSGTSDRQMNSAIDDAVELGKSYGFPAMRTNKDDRSTWLLADFVDVIAHLFEPNTRAYYDIEMLWGDAPRVDWKRETGGQSGRQSGGPGGGSEAGA